MFNFKTYLKNNASKEAIEWFKGNLTNFVDLVKSLNNELKYSFSSVKQPVTHRDKTKSTEFNTNTNTNSNPDYNIYTSANNNNLNTNGNTNNGLASSIYWMLQDPIDESKYSLNKSAYELITNRQIDSYNRAAINLLYYSPITVWSSSRLVSQAFNKDSPDGLKIGPFALNIVSWVTIQLN